MRYIGIRHRRKRTKEGEARPTQVAMIVQGKRKTVIYNLATEQDELDFVRGIFPTKYRPPRPEETIAQFQTWQIRWRKLDREEDPASFSSYHLRQERKQFFVATAVPESFDGLQPGDVVSLVLGSSADLFALALARRGQDLGAHVLRLTSNVLNQRRPSGRDKEEDALTLAELVRDAPDLFYEVRPRDLKFLRLRELYRQRTDAMREQIKCLQRIESSSVGRIFCTLDGGYPEGSLKILSDSEKANDLILQGLTEERDRRERTLTKAVEELDVYTCLFEPTTGCGPMLSASIITAISDIRRFPTAAKLKAYCGVHVLPDGSFPRRRNDEASNWCDAARSALWLLSTEQFVKRPNSAWGQKLRGYKAALRQRHPEVEEKLNKKGEMKKFYSDAHIHKMACWRTATRFVEWLFREWWRLEERQAEEQQRAAA
ncbi:MAG: hypothetical protein A2951_02475 [Candidatus Buchananbacteria bacterium RIFCSPLOWO2_01_FULL_56_15]|uniref:Transposase IS116/IS110/IS902 C-terminal domain-containing protein n=2 Tax=Candidatus Buchananiibacteriota TaxID=1817903 RepID=A0A1G1YLE7_9BACT|nr:MAG: hypothetical protein A3J59_02165 [Candidatus Buchananbacteria bacterium RIFCSPHIGHO2_02_FULL_56_16]OGY54582.1 MAG: hypothetical protein A2951_02475 [Candidatus Buchananbacteria bacterium RIFCSPLOWO2_01_FULL_56_15]